MHALGLGGVTLLQAGKAAARAPAGDGPFVLLCSPVAHLYRPPSTAQADGHVATTATPTAMPADVSYLLTGPGPWGLELVASGGQPRDLTCTCVHRVVPCAGDVDRLVALLGAGGWVFVSLGEGDFSHGAEARPTACLGSPLLCACVIAGLLL